MLCERALYRLAAAGSLSVNYSLEDGHVLWFAVETQVF